MLRSDMTLLLMHSRDVNLCLCTAGVLRTTHAQRLLFLCSGHYTLSVKLSDFTVWLIPDGKPSKLRSFDRQ